VPAHVVALSREALQFSMLSKVVLTALTGAFLLTIGVIGLYAADFGSAAPLPARPKAAPAWVQTKRLEVPDLNLWCVVFSPDGKRIAAGAAGPDRMSGELRVWDADTHEVLLAVKTPRSVRSVAFTPDGKTMVTAEHDGMARVRDAVSGDVRFTLRGHKSQTDSVAISADGKIVATTAWDQTIKLWNISTGEEMQTLEGHHSQVFTVAFGGPGGALASGGVDRIARIWRPGGREPIHLLRGHEGVVHWLAFAPDGKMLATASWDKTVRLWDADSGAERATLLGHAAPVHCVAFAPDGKTLASSAGERMIEGAPGEIILWDLVARKARSRLAAKNRVYGVAFSHDGATLAAACWDGSVLLWKEDPDAEPAADAANNDFQFVVAAAQPVAGDMPEFKKDYAEDFHPTLKGGKEVQGLEAFGPDKTDCVMTEPEGLRIVLPPAYPRQRPGTGVITDFGIKGDFEITATFEILHEPGADLPGNQTDFKIVVVPNETAEAEVWHKSTQNRAHLTREAAGRGSWGQFKADVTKWNPEVPKDQWGNELFGKVETHVERQLPALAKSGVLRLVRGGNVLYFLARDGNEKEFRIFYKTEFGDKDLKNVRLLASTGGPGASLEVRVTDFQIRADGFVKASVPPAPVAAAPRDSSVSLWLIALAVGAFLIFALFAVGGWFALRLRRRPKAAMQTAAKPKAPAGIINFACSHCNKRLKVKLAIAGKKVKCPDCGELTQAPRAKSEKSL